MPRDERDVGQTRSWAHVPAPGAARSGRQEAAPNDPRPDRDGDHAGSIGWWPITICIAIGVIVAADLASLFYELMYL